jgi:hypothetical protein
MEQKITLTLNRADAEMLVRSLQHRKERLCDIRKELCDPEPSDELERAESAYFGDEGVVVERVIKMLCADLETAPA